MGNCSYCDSFILFGGRRDQSGVYCNAKCQQAGQLLLLSAHIQPQELDRLVEEVYRGNCPRCNGPGPVDVHKAHEVWSALVLTSWSSRPTVSCKSCATKRQVGAIFLSGLLGWWGFPWGLIMTPLQIGRNITEIIGGPKSGPSPLLKKLVQLQTGAQIARNSGARSSQRPVVRRETPPPLPAAVQTVGDERYMPKVKV